MTIELLASVQRPPEAASKLLLCTRHDGAVDEDVKFCLFLHWGCGGGREAVADQGYSRDLLSAHKMGLLDAFFEKHHRPHQIMITQESLIRISASPSSLPESGRACSQKEAGMVIKAAQASGIPIQRTTMSNLQMRGCPHPVSGLPQSGAMLVQPLALWQSLQRPPEHSSAAPAAEALPEELK